MMTPEHSERLPSGHRLRTLREFTTIKRSGVPIRGRHCLLLVVRSPGELSKVGFIASRKGVGGAVQRNRARRRLREIVRRRWSRVPSTGVWLAFVAFRTAVDVPHPELEADVERLLAEALAMTPDLRMEG